MCVLDDMFLEQDNREHIATTQNLKKHLHVLHKEINLRRAIERKSCRECEKLPLSLDEDIRKGQITGATIDRIKDHIIVLREEIKACL
jgi:hypothetical protein